MYVCIKFIYKGRRQPVKKNLRPSSWQFHNLICLILICLKIILGKLMPKYEKKNRLTKIKVLPFKTLHTLAFPKILNA